MYNISQNHTAICPLQSDSPLSIAASWIGIVTFITTTLGGSTIFYTLYKTFEKAQEDVFGYGKAISMSSKELIADIETMEPMLQRLAHKHHLLENAMGLVVQTRELTNLLDANIQLKSPESKGIWRVVRIYRIGRNPELTNTMREMERVAPSLQAMKTNLILMRLDEQDKMLHKLVATLKAESLNESKE